MKKHYNKATLIGRLTRDPEMRTTASGIAVTRFTIAVDRFRRSENGEKTADFIRIVAWRRLAEIVGQYMKKGKLVAVEGALQLDTYEKDGMQRESVEVIANNIQMLDRAEYSESQGVQAPVGQENTV
jgi:single-strand DNA-binding protein